MHRFPASKPFAVLETKENYSIIFEFDSEGHFISRRNGFDGIPEPICPSCNEPIAWCLDMFSFSTLQEDGTHVLRHAQCNWLPSRFTTLRNAAVRITALRRKKEQANAG